MIDDLLEELAAAGTVDSEGEFTLDRAKAREKLRRFQLADPRAYVLELVQAAALKGATWATFEIDSRDMVMELDGRPFTTADFDDIYGAALTRRLDPDVLARRQLGLGLGSAMALRPSWIEVESGDGKQGARLRLRPDGEDVFEAIETTRVGTRIHVRERFTLGTFAAFFKNLSGSLAEEQLLRARCGYASFGIGLEGARLDHGLVLEDGEVLDPIAEQTKHTRVVCGLRPDGAGTATLRLVKDGVWITDHELPTARFPAGFFAIAQDHEVRKDVSQGDIVRDPAYERMLGVVGRGCRRALVALAERALAGTAPPWAELELLRQLHELARIGTVVSVNEPTGLVKALRRVPLWTTTTARSLCLDELLAEADAHGSVGYIQTPRFGQLVPPGRSFVVLLPARTDRKAGSESLHKRTLDHALRTRLRDVTAELDAIHLREQARQFWRARPTRPVLPEGAYLCRRTFAGPGVRGELGLTAETGRRGLGFVVDGCLLVEHGLPLPWLGLRVVIEADAFRPNEAFDGIEPTAAAATAILHAALEIPSLYAELVRLPESPWRDACAMSMLESMLRGDSLAALVPWAGDPPGVHAEAVRGFGPERLRLDAGLGGDTPHPLTSMPLVRRLGRRPASLHDLVLRARSGEAIRVVGEVTPGIEADILVLDDDERALLEPLFARPFVNAEADVARMVSEREFLRKPLWQPPLDNGLPWVVVVPIEGEGITGRLQIVPRPGPAGSRMIDVLHQRRKLDTLQLVLAGECKGWVESTEIEPSPDHRHVTDDEALDRVRAAVLRAFAAACLRVAERSRVQPRPDDAAFLREVVALVFPSRPMRIAFDQLADAKGVAPGAIADAYRRIYAAMHVQANQAGLADRLTRLSWSKTAVADALAIPAPPRAHDWALAAVDVLFPPADAADELARRALRPVAPLAELPLFSRHDGRLFTLAELRDAAERKQTILHTDVPVSVELGERIVAVVDPVGLDVLYRLVGRGRLLSASGPIEQARKRAALEARPKVEDVALPPGAALVSVRLRPVKGRPATEGEVGLRHEHPGDPTRRPVARITAYQKRAELGTAELADQPAWLVAAVDDHRLALSSDHKGVERGASFDAVVERCRACVPELVTALASSWSRLTPAVLLSAWYHLLDFMVAHPRATLGVRADAGSVDEVFAAVASVPGFIGAGGVPLSALELSQVHLRHGRLETLPAPFRMWGESPLPPDRPVVCVDPYELVALQSLLPRVEDVSVEWPTWQERGRNRAAAPVPRTLSDAEALVGQEIAMEGLEGRLAIPVAGVPLTIELCAEGKVIAARTLAGVLPCWGSVSGARITADDRFTDAIVDGTALHALRLRSLKLYDKLARWLRANADHPEHERIASMLSDVVVTLRRGERAGTLSEPQGRLLHDLAAARVLRLTNGRRISLHKALEEQPGELAHLELWEAPGHRLERRYAEAASEAPVPVAPPPASAPASTPSEPAPAVAPAPAPEPEPARAPAPAPAPAPPPPTPEERLADALRAELGLVRTHNERLLANVQLDRIRIVPLTGDARWLVARADAKGVIVNRDHPVVARALAGHGTDPVWCSYVASAVYTALNVWLHEITDADERRFLELFAGLVAGR